MPVPSEYSFPRYLAAKKSVDDRALNQQVWGTLLKRLNDLGKIGPSIRILEVGGGIGTMVERMLARGALDNAEYTLIDGMEENIAEIQKRLPAWGVQHGYQVQHPPDKISLMRSDKVLRLYTEPIDLFAFMERETGAHAWDVLIANAFLDLVDIPATLPGLLDLVMPGGMFYFTINFDGLTSLEPEIDPDLEATIYRLYHSTMDRRLVNGKRSGDSRAGRHLFSHLNAVGGKILAAGASDWVVHPYPDGYPGDEAYFLHFILHTIDTALRGHSDLDPARFVDWIAQRHDQIESGELVYIAHQLDFVGYRD